MAALKPLVTLLECAERERDDARLRFERARTAHQAAADQAEALRVWRSEYAQRWQTQFQTGGSVEIVRCYQDFMGRLGQAIAEQDIAVERARGSLEAARAVLQAREQRVGAVEQLIDRRRRETVLAESRREQKQLDEQAARAQHGLHRMGGAQSLARFGTAAADPRQESERDTRPAELEPHSDFVSTST